MRKDKQNKERTYKSNSSSYSSYKKPRYYYLGTSVYFHTHSSSILTGEKYQFFCKGLVARKPLRNSQVYKVIVTSVCPVSAEGVRTEILASKLLGKRIPKGIEEITDSPMSTYLSIYNEWIDISPSNKKKIENKIEEKIEEIKERSRYNVRSR